MEIEKEFELNEVEFESESSYIGRNPKTKEYIDEKRKYSATLVGDGIWSIENDSFDYSGTHCTGGRDGTHHLPDHADLQDFTLYEVHIYFEIYDNYSKSWFDVEREFKWKNQADREFITRFEKEQRDLIMMRLQENEEQYQSVVESLS